MELNELNENLAVELVTKSSDIITDIAEMELDKILDDGIVKEIPVVKTIAAVCKIGLNIKDRYFAKKLIFFINDFRTGQLDIEKYNEFKTKMEDANFKKRVTENIIICLDRLDSTSKVKMISNLFISYINRKITWDEFILFSNIVNYLMYEDYETLKLLYDEPSGNHICFSIHERKDLKGSAYKLVQFSLVDYEIVTGNFFGAVPATILHKINPKGISFYEAACNI